MLARFRYFGLLSIFRKRVAIACFVAGFLLILSGLSWTAAAVRGVFLVPSSGSLAVAAFAPYAVLMLVTLDRGGQKYWQPLFTPTRERLILTRIVLIRAATLVLALMITTGVATNTHNEALRDAAFPLVIGSLIFLKGCYVSAHWAFRPENLLRPALRAAKFWFAVQRGFFIAVGLLSATIALVDAASGHHNLASGDGFSALVLACSLCISV
jgi:hypothetical protein